MLLLLDVHCKSSCKQRSAQVSGNTTLLLLLCQGQQQAEGTGESRLHCFQLRRSLPRLLHSDLFVSKVGAEIIMFS